MTEQPRHPRVSIAERIKSRYVHDLDALEDDCRQLIHELEIMRQDVAEARTKRGGQAKLTNENRISNTYRSLMKKIGVVHALQQAGAFNPQNR